MKARLLPLLVFFASCADLPAINAGSCGNGVIESGEDCDGVAPSGARCRRPDEANACHFDCRAEGSSCPSGWLCGPSAGICSQPSGDFAVAASEFETTSGRILLGDLDGDAISEIVTFSTPDPAGRTTPRAFYFDDITRGPAKTLPVRAPAIGPELVDLSGDGVQDLVFSTLTGLNVMVGASDRTLTPIAFSRFTFPTGSASRMTRIRGVKSSPTNEAPVMFADTGGGVRIIGGVNNADNSLSPIAVLEKSPAEVLGIPRAANLIDGPNSPCEEIYWVWKGASSVSYAEACTDGGLWPAKPELLPKKFVTLPDGDVVDEGVRSADVNGDGHLDLLIGGKANDWVGFGRGDGTFSGDPSLAVGAELAAYTCATASTTTPTVGACEFPIAIGAYQASHVPAGPVIVLSDTIAYLSGVTLDSGGKPIFSVLPVVKKSAGTWSVAQVGDLNANGFVDVIAGSADGQDLDFYNGTPSYFFNPSKISTDRAVRQIEIGDFDGDLVNDIVFTQIDAGGPGKDSLSVAYGRFMATPETPFSLGTFDTVVEMQTAAIDRNDFISGIGLISGGDGERVAILTGEGERQLLSPYGFNDQSGMEAVTAAPTGVAVGHFDADAIADLAIVGVDQVANATGTKAGTDVRLWATSGKGGGALGSPQIGAKLDSIDVVAKDAGAQAIVSVLRAADLDGDKIDEAVLFAATLGKQTGTLLVAKASTGKNGPALAPTFQTVVPSGWIPSIGSDLRIVDVDGDGKLDAVVLSLGRKDKGQLMVYFGDGKGAFDATPVNIDLGDLPRGFAIVPGTSTIAAVTEKNAFLIRASGRTLTPKKLDGFAGGTSIAAGDVSGDGLPDLVIGDGERVRTHLGVAK